MSKTREFAILFGSLATFGIVLGAVEEFKGFETMVWVGFFMIFAGIISLALQIEKLRMSRRK